MLLTSRMSKHVKLWADGTIALPCSQKKESWGTAILELNSLAGFNHCNFGARNFAIQSIGLESPSLFLNWWNTLDEILR